jgi:ferredoxin
MGRQTQGLLPVTDSMLRLFDLVVTPDEVEFLLLLDTEPMPRSRIMERTDLAPQELETMLERTIEKGLVWTRVKPGGDTSCVLAPIMPGWFEMYLAAGKETPDRREFARRMSALFEDYKMLNVFPLRPLRNFYYRGSRPLQSIAAVMPRGRRGRQVVEVNREIRFGGMTVQPAGSINALIEKYGDGSGIAVMHCFCRQHRKLVGEPCGHGLPAESCLVLGEFVDHIVDHGFGRRISKSEAMDIIRTVQKKGAVHQVFYDRGDTGRPELAICNCCTDCCGIFRSYHDGITHLSFRCLWLARVMDPARCRGCGTCEASCPVRAIRIQKERIELDESSCIGCGQCVSRCGRGVIALVSHERDVFLPLRKPGRAAGSPCRSPSCSVPSRP